MKSINIDDLSTSYSSDTVESKWYKKWEDGKYFKPKAGKAKKSFCIIMPPPNVTGKLHAGHALDVTTQDALIRFKRMKGYETLWLPGSDHAGIATQSVVEKMVWEQEKKRRLEFKREDFVAKIWEWKKEYGDIIAGQMRSMGASPDWDYAMFTMDPEANEAVRKVFTDLFNEGLIYQSDYIVNWDPTLQSAISDAEVEHREINGAFYHLKYQVKGSEDFLEIATTRPETLLGDTAVCVHPDDDRFKKYIGKTAIVPLCNREVPIIADEYVDMEKGTGCLKVTPGHDFNDFELGKKHNLPIITILNKDATMNENAMEYNGLKVQEARKRMVKVLEESGILIETKKHVHQVGHGDRSGAVIEPLVSKQWFLNVKDMAKVAVDAVKDDTTRFFPKGWENTYFSWLNEPKDWCISRQLWWGHQIPVFYCQKCNHQWAHEEAQKSCPKCQAKEIHQDPDVLDTWFSSALWPISTLGWPNQERMKSKGFETFYPTSTLVTGHDIIFFWVARMMMMCLKFTKKVPFDHVYIHAIVRDKIGRKMSKSLGNGIDPLDMIAQYGADAFRFTLASGSGYNRGINLDPDRISGFRNFINKIWNAFRFIAPNLSESKNDLPDQSKLHHHERWILAELNTVCTVMNESMDEYRFDESCAAIYSFVYDKFCSWFIELSKPILKGNDSEARAQRATVLRYGFRKIVALLHPFTPYITEELWSFLKNDNEDLLIAQEYPEFNKAFEFTEDQDKMNKFIEVVSSIRYLRQNVNIKPKEMVKVCLYTDHTDLQVYFEQNRGNFESLANVNEITIGKKDSNRPEKSIFQATTHTEIFLPLEGVIDIGEQIARLTKELVKTEKDFEKYDKKLNNTQFMSNAPDEVVEEVKTNHAELKAKVESLKTNIESFK
ncbi:MAG: valine--tRNA ligase [Bdellovibrio sp. CG12_big_fil_rev_8_21_14_0_65_39_13]|nr:MAG: valine--tRNA ligase [Bdellovibrio sp. CG12_big_fil_rev_8_21_14_0_65_39_13]